MAGKELTGRKVLMITVGAFAVIIGVNLILAYKAVTTFPGLEVKNTYVASQNFDRDRAAQVALGWDVSARYDGDALVLSIRDKDGAPVKAAVLEAVLGRSTTIADDQIPAFTYQGGDYVTTADLAPGTWNIRLLATSEDGTLFRQRVAFNVKAKG
jgi:nitrogen fixation protein FixH